MRRSVPLLVTIDGVQRCADVPLQAFLTQKGMLILRVGDNTLWFTERGTFDGCEAHMKNPDPDSETTQAYVAVLNAMGDVDTAPDEPYFAPGTDGHRAETGSWPARPTTGGN